MLLSNVDFGMSTLDFREGLRRRTGAPLGGLFGIRGLKDFRDVRDLRDVRVFRGLIRECGNMGRTAPKGERALF